MEDPRLIYINELNSDWEQDNLYEFIFSDTTNTYKVEGDYWDVIPASNNPTPPNPSVVTLVGQLKLSDIALETAANSDTFAMYDSIDGVIAIGWEDLSHYEVYPDNRLVFHFGDSLTDVENKLYSRDFVLEYKYERDSEQ